MFQLSKSQRFDFSLSAFQYCIEFDNLWLSYPLLVAEDAVVVAVAATPSARRRSVTEMQVKEKVSSLGIQVDNLCTMLPQASALHS